MWTGKKIIFLELSEIVPFFKEMTPDTFEFACAEPFFYTACTCQACLSVGTLRMRESMPHRTHLQEVPVRKQHGEELKDA